MSSQSQPNFQPTCANCCHHTVKLVPKLREDTEDSIDGRYFVADDEDVKVYSCTVKRVAAQQAATPNPAPYAEREVGAIPVNCPSWEAPAARAAQDTRMADMVAAWEARQKARQER